MYALPEGLLTGIMAWVQCQS